MKWIKRIGPNFNLILVIALLVSLVIPIVVAPQPVLADGEGWLDGWTYRQKITLQGSTAGIQTNYAMRLKVEKEGWEGQGDPSSFTYLETIYDVIYADEGAIYSHGQDVYTDGEYVWYCGSDIIKKTYLYAQDWDDPLAENLHAMTDGTDMDQLNGIFVLGDYIYASAPKFNEVPYRFFAKWYDKDTLEFVGEQELFWEGGGSTQEGWIFHDNYWWTTYFDRAAISRYSTSLTYIDTFSISGSNCQGITWVGDQLWASWTNRVQIYDWDGTNLTYVKDINYPSGVGLGQGISRVPGGDTLLVAEFIYAAGYPAGERNNISKFSIAWEGGGSPSETVYLNNHCQDDFDDIRFTLSDGVTELDYFKQDYTSGVDAIFWAEFNSVPASPRTGTFYLYYGNDSASDTSDGSATFDWYDGAESGTPSDLYTETGGGGFVTYNTTASYRGSKSIRITDTSGDVIYPTTGVGPYSNFHVGFQIKEENTTSGFRAYLRSDDAAYIFTGQWETTTPNLNWFDDSDWIDTGVNYGTDWESHELIGTTSDNIVQWIREGEEIEDDAKRVAWDALETWWWDSFAGTGPVWIDDWFVTESSNPEPDWGAWGSEESQAESGTPTMAAYFATSINSTAATLEGAVVAIGDTSISERGFVWDELPHGTPGNISADETAYAGGNWTEIGTFYVDTYDHEITSLTKGELYYYRAGAKNSDNNWAYSGESGFVTSPDVCTSLNATQSSTTQIDFTWVNGTGSDKVKIMGKIGSYPTSVTDGYEAFFGTGTSGSDTGLTPGTTYFYRAWSYAEEGGYHQYSSTYDQDSAITVAGFAVTTGGTTDVTSTSITLEGTLTDGDSEECSLRFVYGTSTSYGSSTAWRGPYETGDPFSDDLSSLIPNTQYHYRIEAKHADGETVTGSDEIFTTLGGTPGAPTNFGASSTTTQINLSWNKGTGASQTIIYYKTDDFPTFRGEGLQVYPLGSGTSTSHTTDLIEGDTYFYSAWGESDGEYSTTYATTTGQLGTSGELPNPTGFSVGNVKVYRDYLEEGDLIFVMETQILMESPPIMEVGNAVIIQILEGTTLKAQIIPAQWGYQPASIYLAPGHSLTWGEDYIINMEGRTGVWTSKPETTFELSAGSWIGSELDYMKDWVLNTAGRIEDFYTISLVTYVPDKGEVLTTQGGVWFTRAIPGLQDVFPELFSVETGAFDPINPAVAPVYVPEMEDAWGEAIADNFDDIGAFLNLDGEQVGGIIWFVVVLLVAGGLGIVIGPIVGIIVALPLVFVGSYLGFFSLQIVIVLGMLLVVAALFKTILRGI